jgi:hypothetical protein
VLIHPQLKNRETAAAVIDGRIGIGIGMQPPGAAAVIDGRIGIGIGMQPPGAAAVIDGRTSIQA